MFLTLVISIYRNTLVNLELMSKVENILALCKRTKEGEVQDH